MSREQIPSIDETVVGLSPAFWSHVPLTIRQVHELRLVKGINCIVRKNNETGDTDVLPLSKCELVGVVVAVEPRGRLDAGAIYVIDDGTGLIDCLHWPDNDDDGLPSLTQKEPERNVLSVGTFARIFGRIECVAMGTATNGTAITNNDNTQFPLPSCIREIHATVVLDILKTEHEGCIGGEDFESRYWKRCIKGISPEALLPPDAIIDHLGNDIAQQIADRTSLPAVDDTDGAWRVFGSLCPCNLTYKQHLLYCHCQATKEHLDPELQFRDCLLKELIELEQKQSDKEPLRFQFRTVKGISSLNDLSRSITSSSALQQSLVQSTFRALRKDGIFYLLDAESDTYLLISKERVLEPYIETITSDDIERGVQRAKLRRERPSFLQQVPKQRLQYVKRNFQRTRNTLY